MTTAVQEPAPRARRLGAPELVAAVLDAGTFESWDRPVDTSHLAPDYRGQLAAASERSGLDEAVLTGRGEVGGRPVAVVVNDFRFLAGSIGAATAVRIVAAVRRATDEGLPLLASTSSGGTRMQEGTPAFVGMVDITRAVMAHRAAGLPYLAYLRHPTTGGVLASWGSLAHVTVAEPGALVGFLGPKVYEALNGRAFPPGVQTAENLAAHGIIDAVATADELRGLVDLALGVLLDAPRPPRLPRRTAADGVASPVPAWESIERTRAAGRPGVRDLLRHAAEGTVRLRGTEQGEHDGSILIALTRLDGQPCVLVGQDRARQTPSSPMGPGALREARRAMRLAEELRLPLVTVIDTPGAELSQAAEEGSIAGEIARCIATMTTMTVPTVSLLMGQGCGGGALALLPADVVVAAEHAWLSPLPPEGASVIVHGTPERADELAEQQRVRAADLLADGIVHAVVPEPADGPESTDDALVRALAAECAHHLDHLTTGHGGAVVSHAAQRGFPAAW
ncbi:acetyl-CoA carboxylase beta subunit [Nocardioides zeae]|uniref:Acetyl-CoA carboxylase beta subunit n=1 Tax=Nocardioides zeae TaxID=1457234 RepID=A0ACC6IFE5_9ACTN|nr:carboxyl transferase domain-containing protein [Nocardioides zeae]MDR6176386.1 acetyl-CoA carboxylase beta subunit [Nocardioides zeae]MDR6209399.1 acetyl-CoA carboxylase beta subunit [Nocardioides zeae]